jgi:hypothetical protein
MQLLRVESKPQRLAGAYEVGLANDVVQRSWPERFGKRELRRALFKKIIH